MKRERHMQQQELPIMDKTATATKPRRKAAAPKVASPKNAVSTITTKQALAAPTTPKSTLQIIAELARDPNVNPDKIDRLLAAQERVLEREAEVQFNTALHEAQSHMPRVVKDKTNPDTKSGYASLEAVAKAVNPVIMQHGFSLSFGTEDSKLPNHYKVICYLSHFAGHTRKYQADVPADTTGPKGNKNKTDTHGFGSAMSYARRYLTVLMFNVVIVGEDDDGNRSGVQTITQDQCDLLVDLIEDAGTNVKNFNQYFGLKTIMQLPAERFDEAKQAIANVKAQKRGK